MRHHIDHGWTWAVIPMFVALLLLLTELGEARAEGAEQAYLGFGPNQGQLTLWTQDSVYQVTLGEGCDGATCPSH